MEEILNPTVVVKKCVFCSKEVSITVNELDLEKHRAGEHVQNCFPYLTAGEREMFISGVCPECFDKTFADDDECPDDCKSCKACEEERIGFGDPGVFEVALSDKGILEMMGYDEPFIAAMAKAMSEFFRNHRDFPNTKPYVILYEFTRSEKFRELTGGNVTPNMAFTLGYFMDTINNMVANENKEAIFKNLTPERIAEMLMDLTGKGEE